jgi:hypothetical protein
MPQTGKPDINVTIAAWADIVLKIWRQKITEMRVYDSGELYKSLRYELLRNSGNDIDKIEFVYNYYGMFHDRGTINIPQREWKGKVFYAQVMRLKEILSEKYVETIVNGVSVSMGAE